MGCLTQRSFKQSLWWMVVLLYTPFLLRSCRRQPLLAPRFRRVGVCLCKLPGRHTLFEQHIQLGIRPVLGLRQAEADPDPNSPYQAAPEMWRNSPRIHEFIREINNVLAPFSAVSVGELSNTPDSAKVLPCVSASARELDMVFEFSVVRLGNGDYFSGKYTYTPFPLSRLKSWYDQHAQFVGYHALPGRRGREFLRRGGCIGGQEADPRYQARVGNSRSRSRTALFSLERG